MDFNDILHMNKKRGRLPSSLQRCTLFRNRINNYNLIDMGNSIFFYTWKGPLTHGGMRLYEELDHVLCNSIWRNMYLEAHVRVLHRMEFSDHHHVFLTLMDKEFTQVPKSFKFECAWLFENSFEDMLKPAWNIHHLLFRNLDSFKTTALQWKLRNIGSIQRNEIHLLSPFQGIKKAIQNDRDHEGVKKVKKKMKVNLSKIFIPRGTYLVST